MKFISTVMLMLFVASTSIAQTVYLPSGTSGISPSGAGYTGLGIGVANPLEWIHLKSTSNGYIRIEKPSNSYENGIVLVTGGSSTFRLYQSDTDNALKLQSAGSGDSEASPRIQFPLATKDIHLALSGGLVGIGTSSPTQDLHVRSADNTWMLLEKASGSYEAGIQFNSGSTAQFMMWTENDGTNSLKIRAAGLTGEADGTPRMAFPLTDKNIHMALSGGNVGIGTASPDAKLAVNGQIHATEVKVTTTVPGPDYVFDAGYNLPSLEKVKAYIDQYHHLPEVPSAKEMESEGIKIGEMNLLLLKKVEELTLYVIELKSEVDELKLKK